MFTIKEVQMPRAFAPSDILMHAPPTPTYPDDLLPEVQGMLKALADVEVRYERERARLSRSPEPETEKKRRLSRLRERRRQEREPYVKRLSVLERRMQAIMGAGFSCMVH
ncbi:MAG TPA: hypothetical protein VHL98_22020 [Microvirga sp.]|nr:hypothetical protein [Microvirga sp.]